MLRKWENASVCVWRGGGIQRERERERQRDRDRERYIYISLDSERKKSAQVLKIFHSHPDGLCPELVVIGP